MMKIPFFKIFGAFLALVISFVVVTGESEFHNRLFAMLTISLWIVVRSRFAGRLMACRANFERSCSSRKEESSQPQHEGSSLFNDENFVSFKSARPIARENQSDLQIKMAYWERARAQVYSELGYPEPKPFETAPNEATEIGPRQMAIADEPNFQAIRVPRRRRRTLRTGLQIAAAMIVGVSASAGMGLFDMRPIQSALACISNFTRDERSRYQSELQSDHHFNEFSTSAIAESSRAFPEIRDLTSDNTRNSARILSDDPDYRIAITPLDTGSHPNGAEKSSGNQSSGLLGTGGALGKIGKLVEDVSELKNLVDNSSKSKKKTLNLKSALNF